MLLEAVPILRQTGVEPSVLSLGAVQGEFAAEFRQQGVRVDHVPFERSARFALRYVHLLRQRRPDVVHVHTERANAALCFLSRASGTRVVRTVHSVFSYTGRLRYGRTFERGALRAVGVKHVSVGRAVQENERCRLGNPTRRIDNWIGERFRPPSEADRVRARKQFGVSAGQYVVSSIGNCSHVKNHMALLEALPAVARRTARRILYLHAGAGEDEAEERRAALSMPDSVKVRFLGAVRDVLPVLWASDAYCMPSIYEGVSIAALEAAACGTPSVLSEAGGMRDIHSETSSIRFKPPTPVGVAQGIVELQSVDRDTLRADALAVATSIRERRGAEQSVAQLIQLYRGSL